MEKLSNQVTIPCSLTPLTRNIVTGVFSRRRLLRNRSCKLAALAPALAPALATGAEAAFVSAAGLGSAAGRGRAVSFSLVIRLTPFVGGRLLRAAFWRTPLFRESADVVPRF